MTSNNHSFNFSTSLFPPYDGNGQPRPSVDQKQQQYPEAWDPLAVPDPNAFPSQDWTWAQDASAFSAQHIDSRAHRTHSAQDTLLDLGPVSAYQDAANKVDVQSLLKPVAEGWRPPFFPRSRDVPRGYQNSAYTRTTGVMTEPLANDNAYSFVASDFAPNFDSAYHSLEHSRKDSSFRQDSVRDDRSEISEMNRDQLAEALERPFTGRVSSDSQVGQVGQPIQVAYNGKRRRSSQALPVCRFCKSFWPKNRSDHIKHERKHTKPFKCRFPECIAKDVGFSTENDRDRHYKSGRHHEAPTKGAMKGFICAACTDGKYKWWPRQDNFKAHCNRRHVNWNIDDLIKRSACDIPVQPPTAYTDDNTTTFSDPTYQQQAFPQTEYVGAFDMAPLRQGEDGLWWPDHSAALLSVDRLAGVGQALHLADASAGRNGSVDTNVFYGPSPGYATELGLSSMDVASASSPYQLDPTSSFNNDLYAAQPSATEPTTLRKGQGIRPSSTPNIISPQSRNANSDSEGLFTCTECGKPKRRRCELKKHMKRHTRPYICTFPNCTSRHGSRSDWKRHEESQHALNEYWKCTMIVSNGKKCFADFASEVELQRHLITTHDLPAKEVTATLCEHMHLGENGVDRFWCGFCQDIIDQKARIGCDPREMRMQHIGDHFDQQDSFGGPFVHSHPVERRDINDEE